MRMLRWPPAALLAGAGRLQLATLMAGRPLSANDLQHRSGESLPLCRAFLNDLTTANLLLPVPPPTLLPLERTAHITTASQPLVKKSPAQPGLLARMRLQLGLGNMGTPVQTSRA
jgi:hypothetical protein